MFWAKISTETRWSSVYNMLRCRIALSDHIVPLEEDDLDEVLLPASYERPIDALTKSLDRPSNASLQLQQLKCTRQEVRVYLCSVLLFCQFLERGLMYHAQTVHSRFSQSAVIAIQDDSKKNLKKFRKTGVETNFLR